MSARIYDLTLSASGPGQTQIIEVVGTFFKVVSSTGLVIIKTDSGDLQDCLAGQGLRVSQGFKRLFVSNATIAANSVKIIAGTGEMIDDRVTGEIYTQDQSRLLTVNGLAFNAFCETNSTAGNRAFVQLFNGNIGRNLFVKSVRVHSWSTNVYGHLMLVSGSIGSANGTVQSKIGDLSASGMSFVSCRSLVQAAPPTAIARIGFCASTASNSFLHVFEQPLMLKNGVGLVAEQQFANSQFTVMFDFWAEPI